MDEHKKINLKKYISPKVPRRYLLRIAIYILILTTILIFLFWNRNNSSQKPTLKSSDEIEEIRGYSLDTTSN
jgi:hypothetical protein